MPRQLQCLVAGDDRGSASTFADWLGAEGHRVSRAGGADSAVIQVARRAFDLLVLDAGFGGEALSQLLPVLRGATANRAVLIYLLNSGSRPLATDELSCDGVLHLAGGPSALRAQLSRAGRLQALLASLCAGDDRGFIAALRADPDFDLRGELFGLLTRSSQQRLAEIKRDALPGEQLAGPFCLQRPLADGRVRLLLADHRGSREPELVASLLAHGFLSSGTRYGLADLADRLHARLQSQFGGAAQVRASMLEIAASGRCAQVYSAAMGPILHLAGRPSGAPMDAAARRVAESCAELSSRNAPLGGGGVGWRETRVQCITLAPGDRLLLVDGLALGGDYGLPGLHRRVARNRFRGALLDELLTELHGRMPDLCGHVAVEWRSPLPPGTAAAVSAARPSPEARRVAPLASAPPQLGEICAQPLIGVEWSPQPLQYRLTVSSQALRVFDPLPGLLDAVAEAADLGGHLSRFRSMALELLENALEHGLCRVQEKRGVASLVADYDLAESPGEQPCDGGEDGESGGGELRIGLDYLGVLRGRHRLRLSVEDGGAGFEHQAWLAGERCGNGLRGRGIAIARSLSDRLDYRGCGNRVEASFSWPADFDVPAVLPEASRSAGHRPHR